MHDQFHLNEFSDRTNYLPPPLSPIAPQPPARSANSRVAGADHPVVLGYPPWAAGPVPVNADPVLDALLTRLENLFVARQHHRQPDVLTAHAQCRAITEQVAASLRVDHARLLSRDRHQHTSFCRHVAAYLCRTSGASWHVIADALSRDHSSIIHSVRVIQRRMADPICGPAFSKLIAKLEAQVTATMAEAGRVAV